MLNAQERGKMDKTPKNDVKVYIGIDPGKNGGIGAIYSNGETYAVKCPETVQDMADELDNIIITKETCKITNIKTLTGMNKPTLAIEKVHAFPGQGVTSMFNFGKGYGQWLGIIATMGIPYIEVSPFKWQKYYGKLPRVRKDRKALLKHYAQQRFPELKPTLVTTDAILIANWLYKVENM